MKRYQCIKNLVTDGGYVDFKAGNIYEETDVSGWPTLVDEYGDTWNIDENLLHYFQELLDLHVDDIPRDEADREPFTTPEPRRKLTAGWAWFIALVITIGFLILKAFIE